MRFGGGEDVVDGTRRRRGLVTCDELGEGTGGCASEVYVGVTVAQGGLAGEVRRWLDFLWTSELSL